MKNQTQLFDYFNIPETQKRYSRTVHGGAKTKGKRKLERPLSTRKWIHLILKSDKATGSLSLLTPRNRLFVKRVVAQKARKFGVKVADTANVGNHVHLKIRISSRQEFQQFLKSVTTLIARHVTGAKRGKPFGRFWQGLAFTRVLKSALEELNLRIYIAANRKEAQLGPKARELFLARFNAWVRQQRRTDFSTA